MDVGSASVFFLVDNLSNMWAPTCPIVNVMLEFVANIAHGGFLNSAAVPAYSGSTYRLTPSNMNLRTTYTFTIKGTFEGGGVLRQGPLTLTVGCGLSSQTLTFSERSDFNNDILPRIDDQGNPSTNPILFVVLNSGISNKFVIHFD